MGREEKKTVEELRNREEKKTVEELRKIRL
jgi:hypothetical protein